MLPVFRSSRKQSKSLARRRDPICWRISGWVKDSRFFIVLQFLRPSLAGEVGHPRSKVKIKMRSVGSVEAWSVGRGGEPNCLSCTSSCPFLRLMFIRDPGNKAAYNVPRNRWNLPENERNEAGKGRISDP